MLDLSEHGGIFGSGGPETKFVKVTASTTAPSNPALYDIWLNTTQALGKIFFDETDPTTALNDVLILISGKQTVLKGDISKGGKSITIPTQSSSRIKLLETDYLNVHAILGVARQDDGTLTNYIKAYYWDGTQWVQFSDTDSFIFLTLDSSTTKKVSGFTNAVLATNSTIYFNTTLPICIDRTLKRIYVFQTSSYKLNIVDLNDLSLISTLTFNATDAPGFDASVMAFADNGNIVYINPGTSKKVGIFNVAQNKTLWTGSISFITSMQEVNAYSLEFNKFIVTGQTTNPTYYITVYDLTSGAYVQKTTTAMSYSGCGFLNSDYPIVYLQSATSLVFADLNLITLKTVTLSKAASTYNYQVCMAVKNQYIYIYNTDYTISKYDSNGNLIWTSPVITGSPASVDIKPNGMGHVFVQVNNTNIYKHSDLDGTLMASYTPSTYSASTLRDFEVY